MIRQSDIDREVAKSTGESLRTVQRLGFSLLEPVTRLDLAEIREAVEAAGQRKERRAT